MFQYCNFLFSNTFYFFFILFIQSYLSFILIYYGYKEIPRERLKTYIKFMAYHQHSTGLIFVFFFLYIVLLISWYPTSLLWYTISTSLSLTCSPYEIFNHLITYFAIIYVYYKMIIKGFYCWLKHKSLNNLCLTVLLQWRLSNDISEVWAKTIFLLSHTANLSSLNLSRT